MLAFLLAAQLAAQLAATPNCVEPKEVPARVEDLEATITPAGLVDLRWTDPADDEVGYILWRADAGGWRVWFLPSDAEEFRDTEVEPGTVYVYFVTPYAYGERCGLMWQLSNAAVVKTPGRREK